MRETCRAAGPSPGAGALSHRMWPFTHFTPHESAKAPPCIAHEDFIYNLTTHSQSPVCYLKLYNLSSFKNVTIKRS